MHINYTVCHVLEGQNGGGIERERDCSVQQRKQGRQWGWWKKEWAHWKRNIGNERSERAGVRGRSPKRSAQNRRWWEVRKGDEEEKGKKETGGDKIIFSQDKSSHRGRSFKEQETLSWEHAINLFLIFRRKFSPWSKHTRALRSLRSAGVWGPATPGASCALLSNSTFETLGHMSSGGGDLHMRYKCE